MGSVDAHVHTRIGLTDGARASSGSTTYEEARGCPPDSRERPVDTGRAIQAAHGLTHISNTSGSGHALATDRQTDRPRKGTEHPSHLAILTTARTICVLRGTQKSGRNGS